MVRSYQQGSLFNLLSLLSTGEKKDCLFFLPLSLKSPVVMGERRLGLLKQIPFHIRLKSISTEGKPN